MHTDGHVREDGVEWIVNSYRKSENETVLFYPFLVSRRGPFHQYMYIVILEVYFFVYSMVSCSNDWSDCDILVMEISVFEHLNETNLRIKN